MLQLSLDNTLKYCPNNFYKVNLTISKFHENSLAT